MAAVFREAFNPERKLIVRRSMTFDGVAYVPGDVFDSTRATVRRRQMLFNQRALSMEGEDPRGINKAPAPVRFGRWAVPSKRALKAAPEGARTFDGPPIPEDWESLPWFSLRAVAAKLFGKAPANKAEAVSLMTAELERRAGTA